MTAVLLLGWVGVIIVSYRLAVVVLDKSDLL